MKEEKEEIGKTKEEIDMKVENKDEEKKEEEKKEIEKRKKKERRRKKRNEKKEEEKKRIPASFPSFGRHCSPYRKHFPAHLFPPA